MTHSPGKHADFEGPRERAVALRRAGLGRRQIRDRLRADGNDLLNRLPEGGPPRSGRGRGAGKHQGCGESADVDAAHRFRADTADIDVSGFAEPTLERDNPRTVRKNTGDGHHGCPVVPVARGAESHLRVEGWWEGVLVQSQARLR